MEINAAGRGGEKSQLLDAGDCETSLRARTKGRRETAAATRDGVKQLLLGLGGEKSLLLDEGRRKPLLLDGRNPLLLDAKRRETTSAGGAARN